MTAKDLLRFSIEFGHRVTRSFVEDLTDADLLVRSVPQANHIAWQLGHMIASVRRMLTALGQRRPRCPRDSRPPTPARRRPRTTRPSSPRRPSILT